MSDGISIEVRATYLPERSTPRDRRFAFAYTVRISNDGVDPAQLRRRHWIITDAIGETREVEGEGVVGVQPLLHPGESFEYTSGCVLGTPHGSMHGSYQMVSANGERFDARIAPFTLACPNAIN